VLAHEFGHFSQGASMRASYIIRAINHWFARIVYQRDGIDEWLDEVIEESEARLGLIMLIIQLFIQITRGILWLFMMVAHLSSCFLLRQMEFDADRYEVYVSGSKSFASTSQTLRLLAFAHHASMLGLGKLLEKAVMIDNLPRMTEALRNQTSSDQRRKLVKQSEQEGTGPFDTHPCDRARIAAAEKINAEGMFQVERPARELFQHYDALCRNVTQDFYRNEIGRMIDPSELEPVEKHISVLA
jgi:Zn-dependent protease with chaperone function